MSKKTPKYNIDKIKDAIEWRAIQFADFYCTNVVQPNWLRVHIHDGESIGITGDGPTELDAILDAYCTYMKNKGKQND